MEQVGVHPSSRLYPGVVPDTAERVTRTVVLDFTSGGTPWRPTGLYAPPGERITVRAPAGIGEERLRVRIGSWNDTPMPNVGWANPEEFGRFGQLTVGRLLSETTSFGSPFGGLVFVEVGGGVALGPTEVTFEGVIEAPVFELGVTTNDAWVEQLATRHAPMGEIWTDVLHIDAETRVLATVTDAEGLATLWRDSVLAHAELVGQPPSERPNKYPQRFTFDPWESWGAHSGFPIHITQDWTEEVLDLPLLMSGGGEHWGPFHELGHNFQEDAWTFPGAWSEVTCNIHVVHACEVVLGLDKMACGNLADPASRAVARARYFASDVPYDASDWQVIESGLDMWLLLQEHGGGWDTLKQIFRRYRDLPASEVPRTPQAEVDTLVRFFSEALGRDLVPFFDHYKLPISEALRTELSMLPAWEDDPLAD